MTQKAIARETNDAQRKGVDTGRTLNDAQRLFGDPVAWEKSANTALITAKRLLENDASEANKQRYLELKEEYKAAQKAKQLNAPSKKNKKKASGEKVCYKFQKGECSRGDSCKFRHSQAVEEEHEEHMWTCLTCSVTLAATMRDAHERGKKHVRKARLAEQLRNNVTTLEDLMYKCHACQITIAASAREAHEQGKKHRLRTAGFKRGDWFCVTCGQHNFASKASCVAPRCHASKPDEAMIAEQLASATRGGGKKRKRESEEDQREDKIRAATGRGEGDVGAAAEESDETVSDQGSDGEDRRGCP